MLFLCLLVTGVATAGGNPDEDWRTIETEHFRIHYDERNSELAHRAAVLAEEAHIQLTPLFGETTVPPVDMVIIDTVDTANGSAGAVPYDLIRVFAYGPEADTSLGDSDDWLRGLIIHEYIHILHINDYHGIWDVLNAVLGKTTVPNQALPRWYIEGLATYGESDFTEGGRLRNNAYQMYLRMDALSGRFRQPENLGGNPRQWPGATAWYLYGSDFVDYVARTRSSEQWINFNHDIGGALSPIAMNVYARENFDGDDIYDLWAEYSAATHAASLAVATHVRALGETEIVALTSSGNRSGFPRCVGPNELAMIYSNGWDRQQIATFALTDLNMSGSVDDHESDLETALEVFGNGTYDVSDDGRYFAYTQTPSHERFYSFNELYLFDRLSGRAQRLTDGQRGREPAFSPDGQHVAFAGVNNRGGVDLRELTLASGEVRTLFSADNYEMTNMPDYAPDGSQIVFSLWRVGLGRDLFLYDLESGALSQLTDDRALDIEPSFAPDGRSILFSSDRTNIYNAYEFDLATGGVIQLTNVVGGVFSPRRCQDDGPLFVRTYNPEGFDVGVVATTFDQPAPPSYERPEVDYPDLSPDSVVLESDDYNPWRGFYPRSWSPSISQTGSSLLLGATVTALDPVAFHAYTATFNYDVDNQLPSIGLNYSYLQLPIDITLFFSRLESIPTQAFRAESVLLPFEQETLSAGVTLGLNFGDERSGHALTASYALRHIRVLELPEVQHDPGDVQPIYPVEGRFDTISVSWVWSNASGAAYSLGIDQGTIINIGTSLSSPVSGVDFDRYRLSWTLRQYLRNPLWSGHHFAFLLSGGVGRALTSRRPVFAVGGLPTQDILLSVIENTPVGAGFLRGYEPSSQIGTQFHLLNAEYRLPLWDVDTGAFTLPVFIERFLLVAFLDYGVATDEPIDNFDEFLLGAGFEIRMQAWLAYSVPADFRIGYAHGFDGELGIDHVYVLYGGSF